METTYHQPIVVHEKSIPMIGRTPASRSVIMFGPERNANFGHPEATSHQGVGEQSWGKRAFFTGFRRK